VSGESEAENAEGTNNRTPEDLRDIPARRVIQDVAGGYADTKMAEGAVAI